MGMVHSAAMFEVERDTGAMSRKCSSCNNVRLGQAYKKPGRRSSSRNEHTSYGSQSAATLLEKDILFCLEAMSDWSQ